MEEETEPEEKKELITPESDAPEEIIHGAQGPNVIQQPEPPKEKECDPKTMTCNEMPKAMETLTKKSEVLRSGIRKLKEINEVMPSPEVNNLLDKTTDEKGKVDIQIQDIVLRFTRCKLFEEKEEEPPDTPPES